MLFHRSPRPSRAGHPALKGIGYKLASALAFTLMAGLVRYVGDRVPTGQVVFFRSGLALVPILLWLASRRELRSAIATASIGGHLVRTFAGIISMFCFFAALARLTLADATMLGYIAPLLTVFLAVLVLREPLHTMRILAGAIGLFGVGLMLWPHLQGGSLAAALRGDASTADNTAIGAMFSVCGAFFAACSAIQVRRLTQGETTASIVFYFSSFTAMLALATAPFGWTLPEWPILLALIAIGLLGGVGQILMTQAYRHAEASIVAPFEYTTLIWSLLIGWFAFSDLPSFFALLGGMVVIFSGLMIVTHERRRVIDPEA